MACGHAAIILCTGYSKKELSYRYSHALNMSVYLSLALLRTQTHTLLYRLGYASAADVIEVKGRVACEISTGDELLLTELIFNGAFNNLTVEQAVALLSCFVFQEKVS